MQSAHKTQAETATKEARAMREQRDAVRLVLENVRRRLHGNAEDAELQSSFDPVSEIDTILRGREKLGQDLESMRLSKTQSDESYVSGLPSFEVVIELIRRIDRFANQSWRRH